REQLDNPKVKETPLDERWWYWEVRSVIGEVFLFNYQDYPDGKISPYDIFDGEPELVKTTPRLILQLLGTECGREIIHPNIWVNCTLDAVEKNTKGSIITDVRFVNEAEAIRENKGYLIRIERNIESNDNHPSEISLDNYEHFDKIIYNDKDIIELTKKINECF
ncbi:MAG: hypothetical protein J5I47_06690, partial [Vicingus serpentipes]|nr:hypothetical protein [Vicingus serpentipes]